MTMNRPLVLLAGSCLVLLMALYGAHARPESDLSKRGPALEAKLQTNPLSSAGWRRNEAGISGDIRRLTQSLKTTGGRVGVVTACRKTAADGEGLTGYPCSSNSIQHRDTRLQHT
ncbi:hypothetical protein V1264_005237 [Littorina saxatilis]|uniref:Uncharacterized protein n=1 Tax=Littorina saxatilis TaxID=31220 RepID=A0AAN9AZ35_9CAEN